MQPSKKYAVLCLLYTTQTIPIAFMGTAIPAIMRQEGISLTTIAYLSLVAIPSTIKFLWAPLVDRYGKSYFSWMTIFTALYALFFFPAMFLTAHNMLALGILFTLAMACMSVQDIAMDAYAIKTLNTQQRAIGNGIQTGGNYLGLLLGGGLLMLFYDQLGWRNSILLLSLLTIMPVITTLFVTDDSKKATPAQPVHFKDIFTYFRNREFRNWTAILLFLLIPANIVFSFSGPLLIDKGFSLNRVGYLIGICGGSATILSGFASGFLLQSATTRTKLLTAVVCSAIGVASSLVLVKVNTGQEGVALICCVSMGLMVGVNTMVINDVSMKYVRHGKEGTDYSIQLFLRYLLYTPMIILCGSTTQRYGYGVIFYAMAALILLVGIMVLYNFRRRRAAGTWSVQPQQELPVKRATFSDRSEECQTYV